MTKPLAPRSGIGAPLLGAVLAGCALPLTGCSSSAPRLTEPTDEYLAALEASANGGVSPLADDPAAEAAALARLKALFADFSDDTLRENVRRVYAETLFFRDGFKQYTDRDALEAYMVRSTEPLRSCTFEFEPAVRDGADYYLRWTMVVSLKSEPEDHEERAIGMSHFRFNADGKVVFQQDYWDPTDILYRRIPVANWLINKVKKRL